MQLIQDPKDVFVQRLADIEPSLGAGIRSNTVLRQPYIDDDKVRRDRLLRLQDPVQAWRDSIGGVPSSSLEPLERYRLYRKADQEANLDNEGGVNKARLAWELKDYQVANAPRMAEWAKNTRVCPMTRPCKNINELIDQ